MRTRLIHPGFFQNEDLARLPVRARLLYAGLWLLADRDGRLERRPARIKAAIFPYERVRIETLLATLERAGFVKSYHALYTPCLALPNWCKFQHPHPRESESKLAPEPWLGTDKVRPGPSDPDKDPDPDQDQDQTEPAAPRPVRVPPFRVYAAIAAKAWQEDGTDDLGAIAERFKRICARQNFPYSASITQKALDAARVARTRRRSASG